MLRPRRARAAIAPAPPAAARAVSERQTPEAAGEEEETAGLVDVDEDVIDSEDDGGMIKDTSDLDDEDEDDDFPDVMDSGR